jgi:beta-lactamase regulating signal transducer with metallopeptidase domain
MNADLQWTCNELISALIEGGAQGALIIGLVWACLKLSRRANAATRHAAWFATLLIAAMLPTFLFVQSAATKHWPHPTALPILQEATPFMSEPPSEMLVADEARFEPPLPVIEPQPELATDEAAIGSVPKHAPTFNWAITAPAKLSFGLVACWLVLASIRLGVLAAQLVALRRIKAAAIAAPENVNKAFHESVETMRITRPARLLISNATIAPMVVGFFRPAMLLPKFLAERSSAIQLEHLFRHELAHLARRDDWTNLLQQVIAAIFFFHPGILFVSRRLTAEREIACDDHALAIGRAPREYALFLTEFASQMKSREFTAAPAAWSSNSQLKERIGMILNGKRNASPRVSRAGVGAIGATAAALAIAAVLMMPRFVVAAEPPAPEGLPSVPAPPEAPSSAAVEVAIAATPVVAATPAVVEVRPVSVSVPSTVSVASITSGPREKVRIERGQSVVEFKQSSATAPRIAAAPAPEPSSEPRPRFKSSQRGDREDGDLERRLDRLERMVEDLLKRDKGERGGEGAFFNKNFNNDFNAKIQAQVEKAHRDAEHAQHDAERAMREQKIAMEKHVHIEREHADQIGNRESLKARRQALEARRKQIEKEIQALEKEMERDEKDKDKDKSNKFQEKLDKKSRDTGKDSDDTEKSR